MVYINKVSAVAAILFFAVAIAPLLAEPQTPTFPKMDPVCASVMPDLLEKCFATVRETPTDDCCSDLKTATTTQVTCLCDNYIANPSIVNITGPYSAGITTKCGVFDKYSCNSTSNVFFSRSVRPDDFWVSLLDVDDLHGSLLVNADMTYTEVVRKMTYTKVVHDFIPRFWSNLAYLGLDDFHVSRRADDFRLKADSNQSSTGRASSYVSPLMKSNHRQCQAHTSDLNTITTS
ncbi:hypothetical protein F2Q70_00013297 [Brassica cretica]|uniref:Bifunctional inhibitor/plant lipid transfer protein/seed storage helical domain-containing protein n=1 Tax=Brassica cretica TaxID=69181 RepID=A0A8S9M1W4_BRACR|nr:hypothetical protein F2Q70_00013297 [Brassica cretica]